MPEKESWKSAIQGRIIIKQYGERGGLSDVVIPAGKVFHLTSEERRINQESAATSELDVFKNGMLVPVRLIEDSEDAAEIRDNPNLITESEMASLFKSNWKKFDERVNTITNTATLGRLLDLAHQPDTNATLRQVEVIQERITATRPQRQYEREDVGETGAFALRPIEPN